jgi:hypothetical protein
MPGIDPIRGGRPRNGAKYADLRPCGSVLRPIGPLKTAPHPAPRPLDTFIRGVDHAADLGRESQERDHVLPRVQPRLGDDREPLAPFLVEALELALGSVGVDRGVDRLEVAGELLALAARHVPQAQADEVHDARLHRGFGEDRLDRLGDAFEPVHAADQDVAHAALLELGEHLHPELGALGLLKPHPQHVTLAVDGQAQRQVAGAALHAAALADLEHQRVEEDHRIDVLQRPLLPGAHVVHHRVGDAADQVAADRDAVDLLEVRLDVAHRQPARVQRQDLVVESHKAALALAHDLRLKAAVAIPRGIDRHLPVLGDKRLGRRAVARVRRPAGRLLVRLVAQMLGQLDAHRPLHQPLGQLGEQASRPDDLLLAARAGKQRVDQLVRQPATVRQLPDRGSQPAAIDRIIDKFRRRLAATPPRPVPGDGAQRFARVSLRSPSGLAALIAGETLAGLRLDPSLGPRSRRHDAPVRSCLHRSSDTPSTVAVATRQMQAAGDGQQRS